MLKYIYDSKQYKNSGLVIFIQKSPYNVKIKNI